MPYHLCDHLYIAQFRDELILLDLKRNKYTVCFQQTAEVLWSLLEQQNSSLIDHADVQALIQKGIIENKGSSYPFYIDRKRESAGVSNVDWKLPLESQETPLSITVLKAFLTLLKVKFSIKTRGFYSTIHLIKRSRQDTETYTIPKVENLKDLASVVNKACLMYPTRTKCLEWAITFVLLALKRKWKCNLEIGVQNYPFCAHAWVECNGQVVMDSEDLRGGLAIILNEPFRKLKG